MRYIFSWKWKERLSVSRMKPNAIGAGKRKKRRLIRVSAVRHLYLVLASPIVGIYYLSTSFLQASGSALPTTMVSVLRQGGILIPSLYLMEQLLGFTGIAVAHTIADFLSVVIAAAVCRGSIEKSSIL